MHHYLILLWSKKREKQILGMVFVDPVIPDSSLHSIKIPVLVATADHDAISLEHSVRIYKNIKNAQFAVLNNASSFCSLGRCCKNKYADPGIYQ
jgi:pimeloyl-ACP methyl ester carboxylesterase